jgi:hypothetical protein
MKARKLTKAQERRQAIVSLIAEAIYELEDAGEEKMLYDGAFINLCDTYTSDHELSDEYVVTQADLPHKALNRLFKLPLIQSALKNVLRSVVYHLRSGLPPVAKKSARHR